MYLALILPSIVPTDPMASSLVVAPGTSSESDLEMEAPDEREEVVVVVVVIPCSAVVEEAGP